jgi:spore coat protein U-like protein
MLAALNPRLARRCAGLAGLVLLCAAPRWLWAQSCSAGMSAIQFGEINPIAGGAVRADGLLTVSCTWPLMSPTPKARVCLDLGPADNAASDGNRAMSNGANRLMYQLSPQSGQTPPWGAASAGGTPVAVTLTRPATGTTASTSVRIYGQVLAQQQGVPTANNASTLYRDSYSAAGTRLAFGFYALAEPACAALPAAGAFPFQATATVANNCTITATDMNFGNGAVSSGAQQARSTINVTCTRNDAFRISLNGGAHGNVTDRVMQRVGGGGALHYQLYQDGGRGIPWGDGSMGSAVASGTGTGQPQALQVYGNLPAQAAAAPGSYADTVTATVVF